MPAQYAGRKGRPWRTLRRQVLDRDEGICWRCGHPGAGEVDHLHRRADGGSNTSMDNLAAAHGSNAPCFQCTPTGRHCNQESRRTTPTIHIDPATL